MATWKKVIVSGSSGEFTSVTSSVLTDNNLVMSQNGGALVSSGITLTDNTASFGNNVITSTGASTSLTGSFKGDFDGTASWASNAVTASYALTASYLSGAFDGTASYALTASYVKIASQNIEVTYYGDQIQLTGSAAPALIYSAANSSSILPVSGSNSSSAWYSTVGGGQWNRANGVYSTIAGGSGSFISDAGSWATIAGGRGNNATAANASVGGGFGNSAGGVSSTVGGGSGNAVSGTGGNIAGGTNNSAASTGDTIGGGNQNVTTGAGYATVAGGNQNRATSGNTFMGGGYFNSASGDTSIIVGGYKNVASAQYATIVGGAHNTASAQYAGIFGGLNNSVTHTNSFIIGSNLTSSATDTTYVNNLNVSSSLVAPQITGSLFGSASYAISASFALTASHISGGLSVAQNTNVIYNSNGTLTGSGAVTIVGNSFTASQDISIGSGSGNQTTIGRGGGNSPTNIVFGSNALVGNSTGLFNIALGTNALGFNNGSHNTSVGNFSTQNALNNSGSTAIGASTLRNLSGSDSLNNLAIGALAASALNRGSNNVFIGGNDGSNYNLLGNTPSDGNIVISDGAGNVRIYITGSDSTFNTAGYTMGIGYPTSESLDRAASLHVKGGVLATSFTGSLLGTSSWAENAITASHALRLASNVDITASNVLITGDLVVQGTASFQNAENLVVADRFILLASGSNSAGDGGIIIQQDTNGTGQVFGFDGLASNRWGVTGSLDISATSFTPDAFMAVVVTGSSVSNVAGVYEAAGNMFVNSAGEIYIYS